MTSRIRLVTRLRRTPVCRTDALLVEQFEGRNLVNVGVNGAVFGVADNTDMTIMALLLATNNLTGADNDGDASEDYSYVYDTNGDGVLVANALYTSINEAGDI